jgi:hypothetical protein
VEAGDDVGVRTTVTSTIVGVSSRPGRVDGGVYAALLERRPYKPPMESGRAFGILESMAGRLDGDLVRAFRPVVSAFGASSPIVATEPLGGSWPPFEGRSSVREGCGASAMTLLTVVMIACSSRRETRQIDFRPSGTKKWAPASPH